MRLVTYNVQFGLGKDGRYDLARIASEVRDADIIALQEVDRHWRRSGCVDSPAVLGAALPEHHWVYGANLDMDASHRDAAGRLVNRRRQFGTMILSRWPIVSSRNHLLPKYATLTQHSIQQGALEAVIAFERAGPVRIYSVHLSHLGPALRLPQVEELLDIHARAESEGGAWCGGHRDPDAGGLRAGCRRCRPMRSSSGTSILSGKGPSTIASSARCPNAMAGSIDGPDSSMPGSQPGIGKMKA